MNATQAHEMHTMLTVFAIVIGGVFVLAMNPGWSWEAVRDRFRPASFEGVTIDSAALTEIMPAVGSLLPVGWVEVDPFEAIVGVMEDVASRGRALIHGLEVDVQAMIEELVWDVAHTFDGVMV